MAIKKSELYRSLWKGCDELRGGMDASTYKDYVLALLFVKYVSDKYAGKKDALIEIPAGGSFNDMVALKGKPEIGDEINKIIKRLAEANGLVGVIDIADFNDPDKLGKGKDMQDRLSNLVAIFENPELDFSKNKAEGDDILGDAYEYLMRHFATESGKSKGQFYTPAEVSRVMAKVIGISQAKRRDQTVYDPTCGSGSLLLKAASETQHGISIYGQENDVATRALAVMNMWLHENPEAEIWRGNTISEPHFKNSDGTLKTFDFVVANPPFSYKSWSNGIDPMHDEYLRFEGFGVPPKKNGDYSFLLHIIKSMNSTGKAAVILPHGVLFRGHAEAEIRKNVIRRGYIKGIIGLPANLFYGTGIPACIIVLDKENAENRKKVFMIDASNGFIKDGNKNRLRARDIHKIVDVFNKQLEIPNYSRMINLVDIEKNDFNLNIPRYIESSDGEDMQDIEAHLLGGIPQNDVEDFHDFWKVCPSLKDKLFNPSKREGYYVLKVETNQIKSVILKDSEFLDHSKKVETIFKDWKEKNGSELRKLGVGSKPKEIIDILSEALLSAFSNMDLIDKYDIYQHLMTYWENVMQDDIYLIAVNGWKVEITRTRNKKGKETGWHCDLIPKSVVIAKYFVKEQETIAGLESDLEIAKQEMQTLEEENSGEEDVFSEVRSSSGKINKVDLTRRIKEIRNNEEFKDELNVLQRYFALLEKESEVNKKLKTEEAELDAKLLKRHVSLTEYEIKELVIEYKWMGSLHGSIKREVERISYRLAGRVIELADRYSKPLPQLTSELKDLSGKVDGHLKEMGFKW